MTVEYHPLTVSDLNNAVSYYNRQRLGLGDELRSEIYSTIERIEANPYQFGTIKNSVRRALVHRFPYAVLFRVIDDSTIRVLVIRHHRRRPSFGLSRR
jgi:plasmid stabilization system protein ParE